MDIRNFLKNIEKIVRALLEVKRIADNVGFTVNVCLIDGDRLLRIRREDQQRLNNSIFKQAFNLAVKELGISDVQLGLEEPARLSNFEIAISKRLCISPDLVDYCPNGKQRMDVLDQISEVIIRVAEESIDQCYQKKLIQAEDGVWINTYSSGDSSRPAIMLVNPCGMPFELSRHWFDTLNEHYFVVTWETRGLFLESESFDDMDCSLSAQVGDMMAVMKSYEINRCSVIALCIGVAIALKAVAVHRKMFECMVLGNGFFALHGCPKTETEEGLHKTITAVQKNRSIAERMYEMFGSPDYMNELDEKAHWTLYPYSSAETLYRYGKLSYPLLTEDRQQYMEMIDIPTHVMVGLGDSVVNPEGSVWTARQLQNATLQVEDGEDHLSVFDARKKYAVPVLKFFQSQITERALTTV